MKQIFSLKKVLKKPPFIYKTSFFCRLSNVSSKHLSWIRKNHLDPPGSGSATQILQKRGEQRLAGTLKSWTLTVKPWRSNPAKYWNKEIKRVFLNRERIHIFRSALWIQIHWIWIRIQNFGQFGSGSLNSELMSKLLHLLSFYLISTCRLCGSPSVFHKSPEYGSNAAPDPHHWFWLYIQFLLSYGVVLMRSQDEEYSKAVAEPGEGVQEMDSSTY